MAHFVLSRHYFHNCVLVVLSRVLYLYFQCTFYRSLDLLERRDDPYRLGSNFRHRRISLLSHRLICLWHEAEAELTVPTGSNVGLSYHGNEKK